MIKTYKSEYQYNPNKHWWKEHQQLKYFNYKTLANQTIMIFLLT